jgi:hypothetical protein
VPDAYRRLDGSADLHSQFRGAADWKASCTIGGGQVLKFTVAACGDELGTSLRFSGCHARLFDHRLGITDVRIGGSAGHSRSIDRAVVELRTRNARNN